MRIPVLAALLAAAFGAIGTPPGVSLAHAAADNAAGGFTPRFHPTLSISRAPGAIHIDGDLDDPGWVNAAVADHFAEVSPGDQVEPPVASEVRVTYDDDNLYVALIAQDDPSRVRVSLRDRDSIFRDDYFGIMIDTYGEKAWGYELFVNPFGIQGDLRMLTSGEEELAFDIVWESEGKLTETGYQVEIAIPFASLRFPNRSVQTWRVNFWRDHQREVRRQYAWAAMDRDNPCFMCQWGTLTGIESITPGKNLELIATGVASQAGALVDPEDSRSGFDNQDIDADAALNVRYGLSSNSSSELALNPDFSQVESDAGQIDVNNPFALFYPEKRPFFQEGSDQYSTWINAIYTRSINDPSVAGKVSGQFGKTNLTYTIARDENSPLILPFEDQSRFLGLGRSTTNLFRARQSIREDTYVGALVTDRRLDDGGAGTVLSADANVRFLNSYRLEFQLAASHTEEPTGIDINLAGNADSVDTFDSGRHTAGLDGETFWGHALYTSLERDGRTWNADLDFWAYSPTFRTDNGFTTRNDWQQLSLWTGPFLRPNRAWLVNWEPSVGIGRVWDFEQRFQDQWLRPELFFQFRGQTNLNLQYLWSRERFAETVFDRIRILRVQADTRPMEFMNGGGYVRSGQGIYRDLDAPQLGDQFDCEVWGEFKPHERLSIEPTWAYAQMRDRSNGSLLFKTYILRTRFNFNFTREWFLRLIVQYNEGNDRLDVEPLLTYRVNPFTVFYVGASSRYQNFVIDPGSGSGSGSGPAVGPGTEWELSSRQFFAKVQYLFRL